MEKIIKKPLFLQLILFVFLVFGFTQKSYAGDAFLTWNPNTESDLAGYKVYVGTASRNYGPPIDVGNLTAYTVTGLGSGTYYFAITAYDTSGNEGGFSNEGTKTFQDTSPPVISAIGSTNITSTSTTINWNTDEGATSQIDYGTTTNYGSSTTLNSNFVTGHSQTISNLTPSTTYHYRVISQDASGNTAISGDNTFITSSAPDTTPPVISNILASNITSNSVVITWNTNESSTSQVDYGTTPSYGSSSALNSILVTSHSMTLTGLSPSTLYNFRVKSSDGAGNLGTSGNQTFSTSSAPDTTGPVINNINVSNISASSAVISWNTDEASTSQIFYGLDSSYGSSTSFDPTLVATHAQTLVGLQPNTLYHFQVQSIDGVGNLTTSTDQVLTTGTDQDLTPPGGVLNLSAFGDNQQILLGWDNPSDSDFVGVRVRYKTNGYPTDSSDGVLLGDFTGSPSQTMTTTHSGFQNGVTYYYSFFSYDTQGNFQTNPSQVQEKVNSGVSTNTDSGTSVGGCGFTHTTPPSSPPPMDIAMLIIPGLLLLRLFLKRRRYKERLLLNYPMIKGT